MADYTERYIDNAPGPFFIDAECIACDTCYMVAPAHFKLTSDCDHAYVHQQPSSASESTLCQEALDACPVDAIGIHHG